MKHAPILALALSAALLGGCSRGTLVSTETVKTTVEARKDHSRRFWVTLVENEGGRRWEELRIGSGKRRRCSSGPTSLQPGTQVLATVETYRDDDTGELTAYVDKADLRRRYC